MSIQQLQQFLANQVSQFDFTGIREPVFAVEPEQVSCRGWDGDSWHMEIGYGPTLEAAAAELRRKIPTARAKADQMRQQAAQLLGEADKLDQIEFP